MQPMENAMHSRKAVVCRYFATSGSCFYGNDCQFLHSAGARASISPTFPPSSFSSPVRTSNSRSSSSPAAEINSLNTESSCLQQTYPTHQTAIPLPVKLKDEILKKTQHMTLAAEVLSSGLQKTVFEESMGGAMYYFSPEDGTPNEMEGQNEMNGQSDEKMPHAHLCERTSQQSLSHSATNQQPPTVYAGPPSFLQNFIAQQRGSFFVNEDIRGDLIQRNLIALGSVDQTLYPDLPQEVDHYHELVPLEPQTLNHAIKSHTYGLITSTYKAAHSKSGLRFCLKRIHGFRVASAKCMSMVELWRKVQQCHLVTLREVFTTKAFGDHSMVFVYDYYPGAETLLARHLSSTTSHSDPFSSDPSAPRPYSMQKNRMLQQQAGKGLLAESLLWSYIIELCSALRSIHSAGLAIRALDPSKVLITARGRLRLSGGGILDVLTYDTNSTNLSALVSHYQQEDLLALGKLILALACNSLLALQRDNVPTSMDIVSKSYSPDLRNLIVYLLSTTQTPRIKNIQEVMPMIGARFFSQLETATLHADLLEDQLTRELDNGRLFRLLGKLGTVVDRPELNMDSTWSETGDRYLLKLFRDYMLHPCSDDGRPWIDLAHVVACLNRLDVASHDKICLTSRDQQNVLVVSYAELHDCLEASFSELQHAAIAHVHPGAISNVAEL